MKKIKQLADISYDKDKKAHGVLLLLVALMMIAALVTTQKALCETVVYNKDDVSGYSQYIKQFNAFEKGQLHLDIVPDEKLVALENPYDPNERAAANVQYLWDHAFYDGKYYSYFGIAPILTVYYPFELICGSLPNDAFTCLILAIYAVIFTVLAYKEVVIRFCKKPNIYLFLLGAAAVVCASGVYLGVYCSDVYYIAVLAAQAFSMAFVFFAFRAMREGKLAKRMIFLVLSALSLVLTVLSRPTVAVMCICAFPIFIEYLINGIKEIKGGNKKAASPLWLTVGAFAVPLLIGAAFVMWFNYARFGSPLDFGANYQLTVNDISENKIEFKFLFSAIFSFLINPLWYKKGFPFAQAQSALFLPEGSRYVYFDKNIGAFAYGVTLGIFFYPCLMRIDRKEGKRDTTKDIFVVLSAVMCFLMAFLDFCMAGINMRYVYDISYMLALVSSFILLDISARKSGKEKAVFTVVSVLLFLMSIYANICVVKTFVI